MDGTGVPTVPADTAGRAGKYPDGRARTREVKLGVLFTQTSVDQDGYPVRDPGSSSYVATLQAAPHFGSLVYAEARRRGSMAAHQLIVLGDGAPWIWNLADKHFPGATQIVDLYHAREHCHALGALVAPVLGQDGAGGWPNDSPTSTAATSQRSSPPLPNLTFRRGHPRHSTRPWATSRPTPCGCAMPTSANSVTSSAPARSRPVARPSSASASNSPGWVGACAAPPASPPCAAKKPAAAGKKSGTGSTTRPARPDLATYKSDAHPAGGAGNSRSRPTRLR